MVGVCLVRKYKDTEADSQCKDCPHRSSSNMIGATSVAGCLCDPGYTPFENQCIDCVLGKYKETRANEECVACPPNSTTSANCLGVDGLDHCYCNAGLGLLNNTCSQCPSNTYWELYWPIYTLKSSRCAMCPAYSRSVKGSISIEGCSCVYGSGTYESFYDEDIERTKYKYSCLSTSSGARPALRMSVLSSRRVYKGQYCVFSLAKHLFHYSAAQHLFHYSAAQHLFDYPAAKHLFHYSTATDLVYYQSCWERRKCISYMRGDKLR
jgi:hypothetical protein